MRRALYRASAFAIDASALAVAYAAAFLIRFDWNVPGPMVARLLASGPYVIGFELAILTALGIHRYSWRYVGLREAAGVFAAQAVSSSVLIVSRLLLGELQREHPYLGQGLVPFGVIAGNYILGSLALVGARVARRTLGERVEAAQRSTGKARTMRRTMLVGAGRAGSAVAREIQAGRHSGVVPVGFLDDDTAKIGTLVHGVPVLGSVDQLTELCAKHRAEQVLITVAGASGADIRQITARCERAKLPTKIIPGMDEIVDGRVNLTRIRDVAIEDLLRRPPVELELDRIGALVREKVVMITGAGGSIGSELARQLVRFEPRQLVLVERAENNLFAIHRELLETQYAGALAPIVADVTSEARMAGVFAEYMPAVVLHAAAHKHVPLMEQNPGEAIRNNVLGTKVVAELAHRHRTDVFLMISTDKAVRPSSVMGATKRVAELVVYELSRRSRTRFVTVRFGNVLGSTGSVVPIFKEQIARGGPVTITHPEMSRYFMTIPEACQLVLQASSMGEGGELFILDMGTPVRIVDLAEDLISLSGLTPGEDIEIHFVGTRPGEKLHEELSTSTERVERTRHPKILVGRASGVFAGEEFEASLRTLERAAAGAPDEALRALGTLLPEFGARRSAVTTARTAEGDGRPPLARPLSAARP